VSPIDPGEIAVEGLDELLQELKVLRPIMAYVPAELF
jgi:hypothetical protein